MSRASRPSSVFFNNIDFSNISKPVSTNEFQGPVQPEKKKSKELSPEVIKEQKRLAEKYGITTYDLSGNVTFDGSRKTTTKKPSTTRKPAPVFNQPKIDPTPAQIDVPKVSQKQIQSIVPQAEATSELVSDFRQKQLDFVGPKQPSSFTETYEQSIQDFQQEQQQVPRSLGEFTASPFAKSTEPVERTGNERIDRLQERSQEANRRVEILERQLIDIDDAMFSEANRLRAKLGNSNVNVENESELLDLSTRYKALFVQKEDLEIQLRNANADANRIDELLANAETEEVVKPEESKTLSGINDFNPMEIEGQLSPVYVPPTSPEENAVATGKMGTLVDPNFTLLDLTQVNNSPFNMGVPTYEAIPGAGQVDEIAQIDSSAQRMEADAQGLTEQPVIIDPTTDALMKLKQNFGELENFFGRPALPTAYAVEQEPEEEQPDLGERPFSLSELQVQQQQEQPEFEQEQPEFEQQDIEAEVPEQPEPPQANPRGIAGLALSPEVQARIFGDQQQPEQEEPISPMDQQLQPSTILSQQSLELLNLADRFKKGENVFNVVPTGETRVDEDGVESKRTTIEPIKFPQGPSAVDPATQDETSAPIPDPGFGDFTPQAEDLNKGIEALPYTGDQSTQELYLQAADKLAEMGYLDGQQGTREWKPEYGYYTDPLGVERKNYVAAEGTTVQGFLAPSSLTPMQIQGVSSNDVPIYDSQGNEIPQRFGGKEGEIIKNIYARQLNDRLENAKQREYVARLRAGEVSISDALLNPRTSQQYFKDGVEIKGVPESRKKFIETYFAERGISLDEQIGSVKLGPTKFTKDQIDAARNLDPSNDALTAEIRKSFEKYPGSFPKEYTERLIAGNTIGLEALTEDSSVFRKKTKENPEGKPLLADTKPTPAEIQEANFRKILLDVANEKAKKTVTIDEDYAEGIRNYANFVRDTNQNGTGSIEEGTYVPKIDKDDAKEFSLTYSNFDGEIKTIITSNSNLELELRNALIDGGDPNLWSLAPFAPGTTGLSTGQVISKEQIDLENELKKSYQAVKENDKDIIRDALKQGYIDETGTGSSTVFPWLQSDQVVENIYQSYKSEQEMVKVNNKLKQQSVLPTASYLTLGATSLIPLYSSVGLIPQTSTLAVKPKVDSSKSKDTPQSGPILTPAPPQSIFASDLQQEPQLGEPIKPKTIEELDGDWGAYLTEQIGVGSTGWVTNIGSMGGAVLTGQDPSRAEMRDTFYDRILDIGMQGFGYFSEELGFKPADYGEFKVTENKDLPKTPENEAYIRSPAGQIGGDLAAVRNAIVGTGEFLSGIGESLGTKADPNDTGILPAGTLSSPLLGFAPLIPGFSDAMDAIEYDTKFSTRVQQPLAEFGRDLLTHPLYYGSSAVTETASFFLGAPLAVKAVQTGVVAPTRAALMARYTLGALSLATSGGKGVGLGLERVGKYFAYPTIKIDTPFQLALKQGRIPTGTQLTAAEQAILKTSDFALSPTERKLKEQIIRSQEEWKFIDRSVYPDAAAQVDEILNTRKAALISTDRLESIMDNQAFSAGLVSSPGAIAARITNEARRDARALNIITDDELAREISVSEIKEKIQKILDAPRPTSPEELKSLQDFLQKINDIDNTYRILESSPDRPIFYRDPLSTSTPSIYNMNDPVLNPRLTEKQIRDISYDLGIQIPYGAKSLDPGKLYKYIDENGIEQTIKLRDRDEAGKILSKTEMSTLREALVTDNISDLSRSVYQQTFGVLPTGIERPTLPPNILTKQVQDPSFIGPISPDLPYPRTYGTSYVFPAQVNYGQEAVSGRFASSFIGPIPQSPTIRPVIDYDLFQLPPDSNSFIPESLSNKAKQINRKINDIKNEIEIAQKEYDTGKIASAKPQGKSSMTSEQIKKNANNRLTKLQEQLKIENKKLDDMKVTSGNIYTSGIGGGQFSPFTTNTLIGTPLFDNRPFVAYGEVMERVPLPIYGTLDSTTSTIANASRELDNLIKIIGESGDNIRIREKPIGIGRTTGFESLDRLLLRADDRPNVAAPIDQRDLPLQKQVKYDEDGNIIESIDTLAGSTVKDELYLLKYELDKVLKEQDNTELQIIAAEKVRKKLDEISERVVFPTEDVTKTSQKLVDEPQKPSNVRDQFSKTLGAFESALVPLDRAPSGLRPNTIVYEAALGGGDRPITESIQSFQKTFWGGLKGQEAYRTNLASIYTTQAGKTSTYETYLTTIKTAGKRLGLGKPKTETTLTIIKEGSAEGSGMKGIANVQNLGLKQESATRQLGLGEYTSTFVDKERSKVPITLPETADGKPGLYAPVLGKTLKETFLTKIFGDNTKRSKSWSENVNIIAKSVSDNSLVSKKNPNGYIWLDGTRQIPAGDGTIETVYDAKLRLINNMLDNLSGTKGHSKVPEAFNVDKTTGKIEIVDTGIGKGISSKEKNVGLTLTKKQQAAKLTKFFTGGATSGTMTRKKIIVHKVGNFSGDDRELLRELGIKVKTNNKMNYVTTNGANKLYNDLIEAKQSLVQQRVDALRIAEKNLMDEQIAEINDISGRELYKGTVYSNSKELVSDINEMDKERIRFILLNIVKKGGATTGELKDEFKEIYKSLPGTDGKLPDDVRGISLEQMGQQLRQLKSFNLVDVDPNDPNRWLLTKKGIDKLDNDSVFKGSQIDAKSISNVFDNELEMIQYKTVRVSRIDGSEYYVRESEIVPFEQPNVVKDVTGTLPKGFVATKESIKENVTDYGTIINLENTISANLAQKINNIDEFTNNVRIFDRNEFVDGVKKARQLGELDDSDIDRILRDIAVKKYKDSQYTNVGVRTDRAIDDYFDIKSKLEQNYMLMAKIQKEQMPTTGLEIARVESKKYNKKPSRWLSDKEIEAELDNMSSDGYDVGTLKEQFSKNKSIGMNELQSVINEQEIKLKQSLDKYLTSRQTEYLDTITSDPNKAKQTLIKNLYLQQKLEKENQQIGAIQAIITSTKNNLSLLSNTIRGQSDIFSDDNAMGFFGLRKNFTALNDANIQKTPKMITDEMNEIKRLAKQKGVELTQVSENGSIRWGISIKSNRDVPKAYEYQIFKKITDKQYELLDKKAKGMTIKNPEFARLQNEIYALLDEAESNGLIITKAKFGSNSKYSGEIKYKLIPINRTIDDKGVVISQITPGVTKDDPSGIKFTELLQRKESSQIDQANITLDELNKLEAELNPNSQEQIDLLKTIQDKQERLNNSYKGKVVIKEFNDLQRSDPLRFQSDGKWKNITELQKFKTTKQSELDDLLIKLNNIDDEWNKIDQTLYQGKSDFRMSLNQRRTTIERELEAINNWEKQEVPLQYEINKLKDQVLTPNQIKEGKKDIDAYRTKTINETNAFLRKNGIDNVKYDQKTNMFNIGTTKTTSKDDIEIFVNDMNYLQQQYNSLIPSSNNLERTKLAINQFNGMENEINKKLDAIDVVLRELDYNKTDDLIYEKVVTTPEQINQKFYKQLKEKGYEKFFTVSKDDKLKGISKGKREYLFKTEVSEKDKQSVRKILDSIDENEERGDVTKKINIDDAIKAKYGTFSFISSKSTKLTNQLDSLNSIIDEFNLTPGTFEMTKNADEVGRLASITPDKKLTYSDLQDIQKQRQRIIEAGGNPDDGPVVIGSERLGTRASDADDYLIKIRETMKNNKDTRTKADVYVSLMKYKNALKEDRKNIRETKRYHQRLNNDYLDDYVEELNIVSTLRQPSYLPFNDRQSIALKSVYADKPELDEALDLHNLILTNRYETRSSIEPQLLKLLRESEDNHRTVESVLPSYVRNVVTATEKDEWVYKNLEQIKSQTKNDFPQVENIKYEDILDYNKSPNLNRFTASKGVSILNDKITKEWNIHLKAREKEILKPLQEKDTRYAIIWNKDGVFNMAPTKGKDNNFGDRFKAFKVDTKDDSNLSDGINSIINDMQKKLDDGPTINKILDADTLEEFGEFGFPEWVKKNTIANRNILETVSRELDNRSVDIANTRNAYRNKLADIERYENRAKDFDDEFIKKFILNTNDSGKLDDDVIKNIDTRLKSESSKLTQAETDLKSLTDRRKQTKIDLKKSDDQLEMMVDESNEKLIYRTTDIIKARDYDKLRENPGFLQAYHTNQLDNLDPETNNLLSSFTTYKIFEAKPVKLSESERLRQLENVYNEQEKKGFWAKIFERPDDIKQFSPEFNTDDGFFTSRLGNLDDYQRYLESTTGTMTPKPKASTIEKIKFKAKQSVYKPGRRIVDVLSGSPRERIGPQGAKQSTILGRIKDTITADGNTEYVEWLRTFDPKDRKFIEQQVVKELYDDDSAIKSFEFLSGKKPIKEIIGKETSTMAYENKLIELGITKSMVDKYAPSISNNIKTTGVITPTDEKYLVKIFGQNGEKINEYESLLKYNTPEVNKRIDMWNSWKNTRDNSRQVSDINKELQKQKNKLTTIENQYNIAKNKLESNQSSELIKNPNNSKQIINKYKIKLNDLENKYKDERININNNIEKIEKEQDTTVKIDSLKFNYDENLDALKAEAEEYQAKQTRFKTLDNEMNDNIDIYNSVRGTPENIMPVVDMYVPADAKITIAQQIRMDYRNRLNQLENSIVDPDNKMSWRANKGEYDMSNLTKKEKEWTIIESKTEYDYLLSMSTKTDEEILNDPTLVIKGAKEYNERYPRFKIDVTGFKKEIDDIKSGKDGIATKTTPKIKSKEVPIEFNDAIIKYNESEKLKLKSSDITKKRADINDEITKIIGGFDSERNWIKPRPESSLNDKELSKLLKLQKQNKKLKEKQSVIEQQQSQAWEEAKQLKVDAARKLVPEPPTDEELYFSQLDELIGKTRTKDGEIIDVISGDIIGEVASVSDKELKRLGITIGPPTKKIKPTITGYDQKTGRVTTDTDTNIMSSYGQVLDKPSVSKSDVILSKIDKQFESKLSKITNKQWRETEAKTIRDKAPKKSKLKPSASVVGATGFTLPYISKVYAEVTTEYGGIQAPGTPDTPFTRPTPPVQSRPDVIQKPIQDPLTSFNIDNPFKPADFGKAPPIEAQLPKINLDLRQNQNPILNQANKLFTPSRLKQFPIQQPRLDVGIRTEITPKSRLDIASKPITQTKPFIPIPQKPLVRDDIIPRARPIPFIAPPFWLASAKKKRKKEKKKKGKKKTIVWQVPDWWGGYYDPEEYKVIGKTAKTPKKFLTGNFGFDTEFK